MRISPRLKQIEKKWVGKRVIFYLLDALDKKSRGRKLDGPFTGTVLGVTTNQAGIEDRLEGHDRRNSIQFTGQLIVKADDWDTEVFPYEMHVELM